MPFLTVAIPNLPAGNGEGFMAAYPSRAAEMKALPMVEGVRAGPIVSKDGVAVTDFKFLQCIVFATAEDQKAYTESTWFKESKARYDSKAAGAPVVTTFEVADFPSGASPKKYTQFSRIVIDDVSKLPEIRKAWADLMAILGKQTWGGRSVEGEPCGLGLVGWDSLEEIAEATKDPKATAAWEYYHSLGQRRDVIVELKKY